MGVDTFCSRGPSILIFKECAYIFRNKIIGGTHFQLNLLIALVHNSEFIKP